MGYGWVASFLKCTQSPLYDTCQSLNLVNSIFSIGCLDNLIFMPFEVFQLLSQLKEGCVGKMFM